MSTSNDLCLGCFSAPRTDRRCASCGYDATTTVFAAALPPGTVLEGQYQIGRVLGKPGGFGITYLAWDIRLRTRVAVKEFFPRDLVHRSNDGTSLIPHSDSDVEPFAIGVREFLAEASTLAQFDHLNIVRVRTATEAWGTAYLVMDFYEGMTLSEYLDQQGGRLDERTAIALIMPVLDGLRDVHAKGVLHRDIKLQNIYLTQSGRPILLDFGAARQVIGERTRSMTAILTPGYAPFEQYHRKGEQGPWTDIYAVGATLHTLITGRPPPEASERMAEDSLRPPSGLSTPVREALMAALTLEPGDRPADAAAFQRMLTGESAASPSAPPATKPVTPDLAGRTPRPVSPSSSRPVVRWIAVLSVIVIGTTVAASLLAARDRRGRSAAREALAALASAQLSYEQQHGRFAPNLRELRVAENEGIDLALVHGSRLWFAAGASHQSTDQVCLRREDLQLTDSDSMTGPAGHAIGPFAADQPVWCGKLDLDSLSFAEAGTLTILPDLAADLTVDGRWVGRVRAASPWTGSLVAGEHWIRAVSADGERAWQGLVAVPRREITELPIALSSAPHPSVLPANRRPTPVRTVHAEDFDGDSWRVRFTPSESSACRFAVENGGWAISNNGGGGCWTRVLDGPLTAQVRLETTLRFPDAGDRGIDAGIVFDLDEDGNYYLVQFGRAGENVSVWRRDAGTWTTIRDAVRVPGTVVFRSLLLAGPFNLRTAVEIRGNTVEAYVGQTSVVQVELPTIPDGGLGWYAQNSGRVVFDDLLVQELK